MSSKAIEPIYFYLTGNWYKGKMPNFYDVSGFESTKILEENYLQIKEEINHFYETDQQSLKPNFTPYKYLEEGWRTINLHAFMLKYPKNIKKFPVIESVINKIPNVVTVQVAVLNPQTRVKAHFGDTNAIIRNHLGVIVPGVYPELGFRNGTKEKCWEEGKVLAICIAHRHYVWNYTNQKRIILLVDTIHPDYLRYKYLICGGLLAASALKLIATRYPVTKKTPHWMVRALHKIVASVFVVILVIQEKLGINLSTITDKLKVEL